MAVGRERVSVSCVAMMPDFHVIAAIMAIGAASIAMRLTVAGLALELVLAAVLTPLFGTVGAAGASCVVSLVLFVAVVH